MTETAISVEEVEGAWNRLSAVVQEVVVRRLLHEGAAAEEAPVGQEEGVAPSNATPESDVDLQLPDHRQTRCPLQS